jgi:hypothetical protein
MNGAVNVMSQVPLGLQTFEQNLYILKAAFGSK